MTTNLSFMAAGIMALYLAAASGVDMLRGGGCIAERPNGEIITVVCK